MTDAGGIAVRDGGSWQRFDREDIGDELQINSPLGAYLGIAGPGPAVDEHGTTWFGTRSNGLIGYDGTDWEYAPVAPGPSQWAIEDGCWPVVADRDARIWAGCGSELVTIDEGTLVGMAWWHSESIFDLADDYGRTNPTAILPTERGPLWVAVEVVDDGGYVLVDDGSYEVFPSDEVSRPFWFPATVDSRNRLWTLRSFTDPAEASMALTRVDLEGTTTVYRWSAGNP
jgi:hypothetical protein